MKKLMAIGEALIDFIPGQTGRQIKQVESFQPVVGGAPANVCGAYVKLGGQADMITQLGVDPFGDKIVDEFKQFGIGTEYVQRTAKANTSLAFVALEDNGNREFSFYRNPGADMLLEADTIQKSWFENLFALHFCSVSLGNFPMKEAHRRAIQYAKEQGALISFDPNLRFALWEDVEELRRVVLEFMPMAHVLKISDEELEFITGKTSIGEAKELLFAGDTQLVIFTKGKDGAEAYTRDSFGSAAGCVVKATDTTGAGDAFIGSFLYKLSEAGVTPENAGNLQAEQLGQFLAFSNQYCGVSVTKAGAIASYPTMEEMKKIGK